MDRLLHAACNFWFDTLARNPVSALVVIDRDEAAYSHIGVERMFNLWKPWFGITEVVCADGPGNVRVPSGNSIVLNASSRELDGVHEGVKVYRPEFAPVGTWRNDATREVSHFDFEIGGLNEWDGAPTRYSGATLRLLSHAHSRTDFPFWAFDRLPDRSLRVVDLGSGPLTLMRWGVLNGLVEVTMVDPLLPVYELVICRHMQNDAVEMMANRVACFGENMAEHIEHGSIDIVFTSNALDHTQEPEKVIEEVVKILKPGGILAVGVSTREGTRQNWDQFHKTDIYLSPDGDPVFTRQDGVEKKLLSGLTVEKIVNYTPDILSFVARKTKTSP